MNKVISFEGYKVELTPNRIKRIDSEIQDSMKKLNNELNISEDLQNKSTIERLQKHIAYLKDMKAG